MSSTTCWQGVQQVRLTIVPGSAAPHLPMDGHSMRMPCKSCFMQQGMSQA